MDLPRCSIFCVSFSILLLSLAKCDAITELGKNGFSGLTGVVLAKNPPSAVRRYRNAMLGRVEASIMGESALIDKETGRIYWEGGSSSTLSASIAPKLSEYGLNHFKATVLSLLLLMAFVSYIANWGRQNLSTEQSSPGPSTYIKSALLLIVQWTILRVPKMNRWLVGIILILYLAESYTCSTRQYLANAIASPHGLEDCIEQLRKEPPTVVWKLRCFHYERFGIDQIINFIFRKDSKIKESKTSIRPPPFLPPFTRKVVTHEASTTYEYKSCKDDTIAGVWARAQAATRPPPFTKILLSKLLVLSDRNARMNYFKQQADFFKAEGQKDEYAEFSTNIDVAGFRPRMLARRYVATSPSKIFRIGLFWVFTLLGLTLPYRIWFARHCDVVRVTVVKETSSDKLRQAAKGWFPSISGSSTRTDDAGGWESPPPAPKKEFREFMQALELYPEQQTQLETHVVVNTKEELERQEKFSLKSEVKAIKNK